MIVIKLQGGLGNQLFQLAAYLKLCERNENVYLDVGDYNLPWNDKFRKFYFKKFNISVKYKLCIFTDSIKKKLVHKICNTKVKVFPKSMYKSMYKSDIHAGNLLSDNLCEINDNTYVEGYFLSSRFFPEDLLNIIQVKKKKLNSFYKTIIKDESVSVHIRRTDYNSHPDYDGICTTNYYKKAINFIESTNKNAKFYFFSDDILWVKKEFGNNKNFIFVENKYKKDSTISDLFLMSSCKHNIIANSTFSWWGAYFNKNPNKIVIRPEKYQNQSDIPIFPTTWLDVSKI